METTNKNTVMFENWEDLFQGLDDSLKQNAYVYIVCTDKVFLNNIDDPELKELDVAKVLEVRAFNAECEQRYVRPNIGNDFFARFVSDTNGTNSDGKTANVDYFDQKQYLDIKTVVGSIVNSINGGSYELPSTISGITEIKQGLLLIVRNYVSYTDGQAVVTDWRLVGFEEV